MTDRQFAERYYEIRKKNPQANEAHVLIMLAEALFEQFEAVAVRWMKIKEQVKAAKRR